MKQWFIQIATWLARPPEESRLVGDRASTWTKIAILAVLVIVTLVLLVPATLNELRSYPDGKPLILVPPSEWHVWYDDVADSACEPGPNFAQCPASPENSVLWQSPHTRAADDHVALMRTRQGKNFWEGFEVQPEVLKKALAAHANILLLGYVLGEYEIWVDGSKVLSGTWKNSYVPIMINVSDATLAMTSPLHLVLRIHHNTGFNYPDMLGRDMGEGFASQFEAAHFAERMIIQRELIPWVSSSVSLLLALLFGAFWWAARKKQEYAAMAIMLVCHSLWWILSIDYVADMFQAHSFFFLKTSAAYSVAVSSLLMGVSFARVRRRVLADFSTLISFLAIISTLTTLTFDTWSQWRFNEFVDTRLVELGYLLGGIVCMSQAYLIQIKHREARPNERLNRLVGFGAGMFGLALVNETFYGGIGNPIYSSEVYALSFYLTVSLLTWIVLREYRDQEVEIQRTPISVYHRAPFLNRPIKGLLFAIDLKKSELLSRHRAEHGTNIALVGEWRSQMIRVMVEYGAAFLQSSGDDIYGFFDESKHSSVNEKCVRIFESFAHESDAMKDILKIQGLISDEFVGFQFRGAITRGEIKPTFDQVSGKEYPVWEEAGGSTPFVDLSRLLAAEPQLKQPSSTIIMTQSLALSLNSADLERINLKHLNGLYTAKVHGKQYQLAYFTLHSCQPSTNQEDGHKRVG